MRRWPDVEKARALLGWEAQIGVEEGVAQTVDVAARRTCVSRRMTEPPRRALVFRPARRR